MEHTLKDLEVYLDDMEKALAYVWDGEEDNSYQECLKDINIAKEVIERFKKDKLELNGGE